MANDLISGIFRILPVDFIGYINVHIEVICKKEYVEWFLIGLRGIMTCVD